MRLGLAKAVNSGMPGTCQRTVPYHLTSVSGTGQWP